MKNVAVYWGKGSGDGCPAPQNFVPVHTCVCIIGVIQRRKAYNREDGR